MNGPAISNVRQSAGFTLVELLVTLGVIAMVLAYAIPSFARSLAASRVAEATSTLYGAVVRTRSEALKRHSRIVMCSSIDGLTCAAGSRWDVGWVIFEDEDANGMPESSSERIAVQNALNGVVITAEGPMRDYLSYVATGRTQQLNGAMLMGRLTVCSGSVGRALILNRAGRPRTVDTVCEES